MKFVEPNTFADPDVAARKLVEIANSVEAVQDGRIYIELVNGATTTALRLPLRIVATTRLWLIIAGTPR